jgi:PAS domain S-box-containing protein
MKKKPDSKKTKAELLAEIEMLRRQIAPDKDSDENQDFLSPIKFGNIGTWFYNYNTGVFYCSRETVRLTGIKSIHPKYSINDFMNTIHQGDCKTFIQELEKASRGNHSFNIPVRYVHSDGTVILTLTAVDRIPNEEKAGILIGLIMEIKPETKFLSGLESDQDRYRQLFELSPTGIILEDKNGKIIDANPAFCLSLGYEREELISQMVHILAHPEVKDQVDGNISHLMDGKVLKHTVKSLRKDGTVCYMELREAKVQLADGEEGILCVAEDHTERVKAQEEHIQKEKLKGVLEMAGAVCHELNQPLTTLFITTDILLDFPRNENIKEIATIIKNEAVRISKLSEKLMHITKYETRDYIKGQKIFDIHKASE